jgi:hypothetical protein
MPVFRSSEIKVAVTGIAAVVALSAAAAILSPPVSTDLAPGSSYSKAPDGSAAAYLTLQSLGYPIRRSLDPITSLASAPATVLILANPTQAASEGDRRTLLQFMAAGGTVVATGCEAASFFGTPPGQGGRPPPPALADAQVFEAAVPSPLTASAPKISMHSECAGGSPGAPFTTLYGDDRAPAIRVARIGRGLALWWAGHTPIANRTIDAPGHLELLLNVVAATDGPDRTIVWDEFYHGQQRSLFSYARQTALPWLLAQTAVIALVAAAMYVRRRTPVIDAVTPPRVSPLEFVDTMAALYSRAGTAADAVVIARARLRRLLAEGTPLTRSGDRAPAGVPGPARHGVDPEEVAAALKESERYSPEYHVSANDALPLVRRLQSIAANLHRKGA